MNKIMQLGSRIVKVTRFVSSHVQTISKLAGASTSKFWRSITIQKSKPKTQTVSWQFQQFSSYFIDSINFYVFSYILFKSE